MSVASQVVNFVQDRKDATVASFEQYLSDGELIVAICRAQTRPPLIIRLLPFIPDLLTRPRKYLLVLTNRRLIIARTTNPFNKLNAPKVDRIQNEIAFPDLHGIEHIRRAGSAFIEIHTKHDQRFRFSGVLNSEATVFVSAVENKICRS